VPSSPHRAEKVEVASTVVRCPWARDDLARRYHDEEWGVPLHDDHRLFEFIVLEGAQAGLSWDTILRKRDRYREAFDNFDPAIVARYNQRKIERLLSDTGIVRNRLKIASAIANARAFLKAKDEFATFDKYIWQFVDGAPVRNAWKASGRDEQGPAQARFQFRRSYDLLRFHAGGRDGQRSPRRLLPLSRNRLDSSRWLNMSALSRSAPRARRSAIAPSASKARQLSERTIIPKSRCIQFRSRDTWNESMRMIGRAAEN
jgi:DNA-3-methyladenine glycosylase I